MLRLRDSPASRDFKLDLPRSPRCGTMKRGALVAQRAGRESFEKDIDLSALKDIRGLGRGPVDVQEAIDLMSAP